MAPWTLVAAAMRRGGTNTAFVVELDAKQTTSNSGLALSKYFAFKEKGLQRVP